MCTKSTLGNDFQDEKADISTEKEKVTLSTTKEPEKKEEKKDEKGKEGKKEGEKEEKEKKEEEEKKKEPEPNFLMLSNPARTMMAQVLPQWS